MHSLFPLSVHIVISYIMAKVGQKNYRKLAEYAIVFALVALLHLVSNILLAQSDATLKVTFSTPEVIQKGNHGEVHWKLASVAPTEVTFSFEIWRSLDQGASFERIMENIPVESKNDYLATDYDVMTLTNQEIVYKVRAINSEGFFKYSDEVHFRPRRSGYPIHASVTGGNPASDNLKIRCEFNSLPFAYVKITNVQGALIYKNEIRAIGSNAELDVDVRNWQAGIYVLDIYKDDFHILEKFVIE